MDLLALNVWGALKSSSALSSFLPLDLEQSVGTQTLETGWGMSDGRGNGRR